MGSINRLSLSLIVLLTATPLHAADMPLAWEFPHALGEVAWALTKVGAAGATSGAEQLTLTTIPDTVCQEMEGKGYVAEQTWCALLPCPARGAYSLILQAGDSQGSNILSFGIRDQSQCTIIPYDEAIQEMAGSAPPPQPEAPPTSNQPPAAPPPQSPSPPPATDSPTTAPPSTPPAGPEPVRDWESGSYAGTDGSVTFDTATTYQGQPTVKLTGRGRYFTEIHSGQFVVQAGRRYHAQAAVKLAQITEVVELDVFWYNTQGGYIGWEEAVGGRLQGTRDWTVLQGTLTPPAGATQAVLELRVISEGGAAWLGSEGLRFQVEGEEAKTNQPPPATHPPAPAPPQPPPAASDEEALPPRPAHPVTLPPLTRPPLPPAGTTFAALRTQFAQVQAQYEQEQAQLLAIYEGAVQTQALRLWIIDEQEASYAAMVAAWDWLTAAWQRLSGTP